MWKVNNVGENNPSYKGEAASYSAVHHWVRRRKLKPALCERCAKAPPTDLANISGLYKRALDDYEYLCRKCHMDSDGRNDFLRASGQSRKLPDVTCLTCGKVVRDAYGSRRKYCGRPCFFLSRAGKITNPNGANGKGKLQ